MKKLGELSNEELLAQLRGHLGKGHVWQARLVAYLAEVDHRQLFLDHACPSMWEFCIRKLGMSESEANLRIAAGRVIRQFPRARGYLEEGRIHLCAIYALRKHLTDSNHEELLREALGRTTREVEQMVAARFPKPDVRPRIEPVAPQGALPIATSASEGGRQSGAGVASPVAVPDAVLDAASATEPRPVVRPLSATRYHVELTVSSEVKSKLERIKGLMRHRNPTGDLETIIDAALDLLLAKLEKERLGKSSRPRAPATTTNTESTGQNANTNANTNANADTKKATRPGYISRETRRQVFARDGEQCTYLDADGNRCPARAYLELDHIHPAALGGSDAAENIRVRCRAHNQHYAEQVFGRPYVQARIHLRRQRRRKYGAAAAPTGSFEVAAKGLRSMGFREAEVSRAIAMLASKLDHNGAPIETIIREALLVLT